MPTYDYRCQRCGHALEIFQSISEPAKKKCPKCGKAKLERLIGAGAGILFKGGGFYQTDYRSDSYKKAESADKNTSSPESGTTSKSSDSPAAPATDGAKPQSSSPAEPKTPTPKPDGGSKQSRRKSSKSDES